MTARLSLTREQVLAHRRRAGALDQRLPPGSGLLRQAAWAGLQDSMPRAALLSIHARVRDADPASWEDPSLLQLWGPRYQVYVVAAVDLAVFALSRMPEDAKGRQRAETLAARLHEDLAGARLSYGEAGRRLGVPPNSLRYAAATGTVVIRWEGARAPTVWTVPPPALDPLDARRELARRYLHVYGPATPASFTKWAGIRTRAGAATFASLDSELTAVRSPAGEGFILTGDEPEFRADPAPAAAARLLPSGDAYWLLHGADRALLVPDPARQGELWTPRVWPGAVLLHGEVRGTWRRADRLVTVQPWGRVSRAERDAVEAEAAALPLPGPAGAIRVVWQDRPAG